MALNTPCYSGGIPLVIQDAAHVVKYILCSVDEGGVYKKGLIFIMYKPTKTVEWLKSHDKHILCYTCICAYLPGICASPATNSTRTCRDTVFYYVKIYGYLDYTSEQIPNYQCLPDRTLQKCGCN